MKNKLLDYDLIEGIQEKELQELQRERDYYVHLLISFGIIGLNIFAYAYKNNLMKL